MRAFVAVEVPERIRAAVAEAVAPVRDAAPGLRWVPPDRYHLTLVFLGEVRDDLVAAVGEAVVAACAGAGPFRLALDGALGTFGRRVLWAGLEGTEAMGALAAAVASAVGAVVPLPDADRPFRAHLTLARAGRKPVSSALVEGVTLPVLAWEVERVVLLRSAGGRYFEVVAAPLAADA